MTIRQGIHVLAKYVRTYNTIQFVWSGDKANFEAMQW